jgi:hypothetical protein
MSSSADPPSSPEPWTELAQARIQALELTLTTAQYQSIGKGLSRLYIPDINDSFEAHDFFQALQEAIHV